MCGITGILHFDTEREVTQSAIKKMNDVLSHRGPDGEGFFLKKKCCARAQKACYY